MTIDARAAHSVGGKIEPFAFDPGPLGRDEVEISGRVLPQRSECLLDGKWGIASFLLGLSLAIAPCSVANAALT